MTSSTADEREEAQIREDTESAYVKIFTTDMVILRKSNIIIESVDSISRDGPNMPYM
jgi:hypothetical protein